MISVDPSPPATSINPPVRAESDAISFSPELNTPTTFVKLIVVDDVPDAKTKPVAPEVLPLI